MIFKEAIPSGTIGAATLAGLSASVTIPLLAYKAKLKAQVAAGLISPEEKELKSSKAKLLLTNLISLTTALSLYYFTNDRRIKPSAVIAGIPIGSVDELSHALSDRIVKYRATGGVFLAHQDGGNQSLRIVLKAFGPNRYVFLNMLDLIFLYGQGKIIDLFQARGDFVKIELNTDTFKKTDPWHEFDKYSIDEGREEFHLTFPIITKNRVYSSMYLETYDTVESVENGKNLLTISLFFRKYIPPLPYEFAYTGGTNQLGQFKKTELPYQHSPKIRRYYREQTPSSKGDKFLKHLDMVLDVGLSMVIYTYKLMDTFDPQLSGNTIEQSIALTYASNISRGGTGTLDNILSFNAGELLLGV